MKQPQKSSQAKVPPGAHELHVDVHILQPHAVRCSLPYSMKQKTQQL